MKKALGVIALATAAAAYVAYRVGKEEPTEEEKIMHDSLENKTTEDLSNELLKNVGSDSNELDNTQEKISKDDEEIERVHFKHLDESDIDRIEELSAKGLKQMESLEADSERPIQHIAYFADDNNRELFKNKVIDQGYVVTNGADNELVVLHISKINKDDILGQVLFLADLTKELHGDYRGWSIK